MRVLHLSTYDQVGGAARAAFRLHEGLRQLGVDSQMLVRKKESLLPEVHTAPLQSRNQWRFWRAIEHGCIDQNRTPLSNTFFTAGYPGFDLTDVEAIRSADVLHLHWVGRYLSPPAIAALGGLGKPLVWTLHDQRAFTGGCHFSAGCAEYERECETCPQLTDNRHRLPARNLADQIELLKDLPITLVTPSRWLAACAARSSLFRAAHVEVIPYGIDTTQFRPMEKSEARRRLGLDPDRIYLLFGSDGGEEKRKGAVELLAAFQLLLERAKEPERITLLCFGGMPPAFKALGERVHTLGYLRETEELRVAYCAADIFALPSLEDNLPSTMLEALACGTPVVGFAIGGVPDAVEDGVTGRLVPVGDVIALGEALLSLCEHATQSAEFGENGTQLIARQFSQPLQAARYQALYASLPPPPPAHPRHPVKVARRLRAALLGLILQALRARFFPRSDT